MSASSAASSNCGSSSHGSSIKVDDGPAAQRLLEVTSEGRTYTQLMSELDRSTEDFLTRNHLLHEKAWYDQTSRKLDDSRRRWEDEVRLMREQFFTSQAHPKQRERAAALMDAYTFDQLQTRTLRGSDGRLRFQVRFEVQGFDAREVEVGVRGLRLTVRASRDGGDCGGSGFRELVRGVNLPSNCLAEQLTACVTVDGVLVVVAPLRAPDSVGGQQHKCCGATSFASPADAPQVVPGGADGAGRAVRLQVQLGPYYLPGEVSVLVGSHRVKIAARHEEVREGKSCFREFQRDYDLPEAVRQVATVASLTPGGCLTVEAPLEAAATAAEGGDGGEMEERKLKQQQEDCQSLVSVVSATVEETEEERQGSSAKFI